MPPPNADGRSDGTLADEVLYRLTGDDPGEAEKFFSSHPERSAELEKFRAAYRDLVPRLRAWGAERKPAEPEAEESEASGFPAIPGFRILRELGRGGAGIVYLAEEESPRRRVALKVVLRTQNKPTAERFEREIAAIARLRSPHIVTLFRSGSTDEFLYFAMELLEGETFESLIARWVGARWVGEPTAEPTAGRYRRVAEILASVCAAADAIHAEGIIHRDLKPSNIFITRDGGVKVIDFGLVRGGEDPTITRTGALLGTIVYMSPEELRPGKKASFVTIDRRSDVYSLGATLYEATTLHRPFAGEARQALLQRILADDPDPPASVDPEMPIDLSSVIQKAMEFDPSLRYQTAGDLAKDLRAFLDGGEVSARPIGRCGRLRRRLWRNRRAMTLVSIVAILAVAIAAAVGTLSMRFQRSSAVEAALHEARAAAGEFRELVASAPNARARLEHEMKAVAESASPAERLPIFEAQASLVEAETRAEDRFNAAVLAAQRGLELDGTSRDLRTFLADFLWERYLGIEISGDESDKRRLRGQIINYAPDYAARFHPRGHVTISSNLPGAEVFLFRYEEVGLLLQPFPYLPPKGSLLDAKELPQPVMRVFREPPEELKEFDLCLGDRVVSIDGNLVDVSGNRALAVFLDRPEGVDIEFERDGLRFSRRFPQRLGPEFHLGWIGYTTVYLAACLETDVFPLVFLPEGSLGRTPIREATIEAGSYLAVLRLDGYRDTRLPFIVGRDARFELTVNLYTDEEIGQDFVYVPAGSATVGGDSGAFYPEPARTVELPDFFLYRYEVTVREYYEFLNDPETRAQVEKEVDTGNHYVLPYDSGARRFSTLYFRNPEPQGPFVPKLLEPAVRGIARTGADRFVSWLQARESARGGRRRLALPSADEFEKAARGADARLFPWGRRFDWSLVSSYRSNTSADTRSLAFASDVSAYDARNLAGGLAEFTSTDQSSPYSNPGSNQVEARVKGGSWYEDLEPYFHVGGHTRERARDPHLGVGFRVVAYPPGR